MLHISMNAIEHTYVSLLADVASHTGFREIRGSYEGLQWCLQEAPKLEKYIVGCWTRGESPDPSRMPVWLRRLALGSHDPMLMRYLRQLLLFCYKAEVQHDKDKTEGAVNQFLETNDQVGRFSNSLAGSSPYLLDLARKYSQSVLYRFDKAKIRPSHGPGAVYLSSKERWRNWYETIESQYPMSDYFALYFNRDHCAELDDCTRPNHIEAKLIAVPKDSRGPRLICVHPAESIWIQQGLRLELESAIGRHRRHSGTWPRGRIQFDDQSVNGRIALKSSLSGRYATLDMKEASDRISESLVQVLFGDHYKAFGCCRAQKVKVRVAGHNKFDTVHDIHSYAPMGNATTFPVQSLVFWSICCASMQYHGFHQPGAAFVFGDDIIVPSSVAPQVCEDLESFGLVVNKEKSFMTGNFRESCGTDAFKGVNVTPVRWKTTVNAEQLVGSQALSNMAMRLRIAGYEGAASTAYRILRHNMWYYHGVRLSFVDNPNHGGIAEYARSSYAWYDAYWHQATQQFVSPVYRVETLERKLKDHGWNHVLESVLSLERTGRSSIPSRDVSRRLRLNRGWIHMNNSSKELTASNSTK